MASKQIERGYLDRAATWLLASSKSNMVVAGPLSQHHGPQDGLNITPAGLPGLGAWSLGKVYVCLMVACICVGQGHDQGSKWRSAKRQGQHHRGAIWDSDQRQELTGSMLPKQ